MFRMCPCGVEFVKVISEFDSFPAKPQVRAGNKHPYGCRCMGTTWIARFRSHKCFWGSAGREAGSRAIPSFQWPRLHIVRPSGLKDTPQGKLVVSAENTVNGMGNTGGEINRENVAKVCVQALLTEASANKVVEIYETKMADTEELPKGKWF